jgi:hypothetical protein
MKNVLIKTLATVTVALAASSLASAVPITGGIAFSPTPLQPALSFSQDVAHPLDTDVSFLTPVVTSESGTFAGLSASQIDSSVKFGSVELTGTFPNYSSALLPVIGNGGNLWAFTVDSVNYWFQPTTISLTVGDTGTSWDLGGKGLFSSSANDTTAGTWTLSFSQTGETVNFESTNTVNVPDSSTTALLVGLGLVGIGAYAARRNSLVKA